MKFKPLFFCLLFLLFFCFIAQADSFDLAKPQAAKLTHKETRKQGVTTVTLLNYSSRLSRDKILEFYRRLLASKHMDEEPDIADNSAQNTYVFTGSSGKVTIFFLPSYAAKETKYRLFIYEYGSIHEFRKRETATKIFSGNLKKQNNLESFTFVSGPKNVDFMPLYSGVKQLEYIDWNKSQPPALSIGYVSKQDSSAIIDFYLQKMPSFDWDLAAQEPHQGVYQVSEWVPMVAPDTNICYTCVEKEIFPEKVPPLVIHGMTLTFTRGNQKCVITVHTFDDIIQQAKRTNYDLSFMEDYGNTIIGVIYFY